MPPSPLHDHSTLVVVTDEIIEAIPTPGVTDENRLPHRLLFQRGQVATRSQVAAAEERGVSVKFAAVPKDAAVIVGSIATPADLVNYAGPDTVAGGYATDVNGLTVETPDGIVRAGSLADTTPPPAPVQNLSPNGPGPVAEPGTREGVLAGVTGPALGDDETEPLIGGAPGVDVATTDVPALAQEVDQVPSISTDAPEAEAIEEAHVEGATADVTKAEAKRLTKEGKATREAQEKAQAKQAEDAEAITAQVEQRITFDPSKHDLSEMKAFAKEHDIDLSDADLRKRDEVAEAITADDRVVAADKSEED